MSEWNISHPLTVYSDAVWYEIIVSNNDNDIDNDTTTSFARHEMEIKKKKSLAIVRAISAARVIPTRMVTDLPDTIMFF